MDRKCPLNPLERPAYHKSVVEGPLSVWRTWDYVDVQDVPADGGLPGYQLELRTCPDCRSTMGREIGPKLEGDELAQHIRGTIGRFVDDQLAKSHLRTRRQEPYIVLTANVGSSVFLDRLAKAIADELEKDE